MPLGLAIDTAGKTQAAEQAPVQIRFGDGPTDLIPVEWAQAIIRKLADDHRAQFGQLLAAAVLGVELNQPGRRHAR
jgi:hypothetical protein